MSKSFVRTEVLRESEVSAAFLNLPTPVVVTGPSGSGKSYLGALLKRSAKTTAQKWEVISLDDYGTVSNDGKWVVNAKLVSARVRAAGAKRVAIIGVSDNFLVVLKTLKPKTVIMLDPPFSMFKQVMRWKFHDGLEMGIRSAWLDGYAGKSILQPEGKIKYFDSKASQLLDEIQAAGGVETFLRIRIIPQSLPKRGWHE